MVNIQVWVSEKGVFRVELLASQKKGLFWVLHNEGASAPLLKSVEKWLNAYSAGKQVQPVPLDIGAATPFTRRVLAEIEKIPFGQSVAYKEIATLLGDERASRAVGSACGRNPVPLFIPCHRVLAVGKKIGGFTGGGKEVKRALLQHEGILGI